MSENSIISERVRGIVRTSRGGLLLIKRFRPASSAYWVFPGGGVEATDASRVSALHREILEELGCDAKIGKLVFVLNRDENPAQRSREFFYLVSIDKHDATRRTGPEFLDAASGQYVYDEFEPSDNAFDARDIKPDVVGTWLRENWRHLDSLPSIDV
jgi:8-oxo-dGTP pyrophosphatase MutT (NUDIX family)